MIVMVRFVLCALLLVVFLCQGECLAADAVLGEEVSDRVLTGDAVGGDTSVVGEQEKSSWEEEEKREEGNFRFVKPTSVADAKKMMLDALHSALDNATDAAKQCQEARILFADANNSASEVERFFKLAGYTTERAGQILQLAKDAEAEAAAAVDECVLAENAAAAAEVEAMNAAWHVLNYSTLRAPAGVNGEKSLQSVQEHAEHAARHAARAGRYAIRARSAAERAQEAAKRAVEAKATASEIAEAAQLLLQKLLGEKQGEWAEVRAKIESEKTVAEGEAAKMAAVSEDAIKRATAAEATVRFLQQQIANAKLHKDKEVVGVGTKKDGAGYAVCGHAQLMLLLMLLLPAVVFAAVP